jgi:hypothetical protein
MMNHPALPHPRLLTQNGIKLNRRPVRDTGLGFVSPLSSAKSLTPCQARGDGELVNVNSSKTSSSAPYSHAKNSDFSVNLHRILPFFGSREDAKTRRGELSLFRRTCAQLSIPHREKMNGSNVRYFAPSRLRVNPDFSVNLCRFLRVFALVLLAFFSASNAAFAQDHDPMTMDPNMPGMDHSSHDLKSDSGGFSTYSEGCSLVNLSKADREELNSGEIDFTGANVGPAAGSGTSRLPCNEGGHTGLHIMPGDDWMLMIHGYATGVYTDQSGPRGDTKTYVQSMAMIAAQKDTSWGRIQLKSMMSLEPLMKNEGYPNLFASGETAGGEALVDRQHPHDLFMELAGRVDVNVADNASVFLYGGPVGEPALGPSAFMHRGSARYNPEAPITHHWFDSSHITYGVGTVGFASKKVQIEGSIFTGREPDEARWNIERPRFDSWSVRATWNPSPQWAIQASTGHLNQPEFLRELYT